MKTPPMLKLHPPPFVTVILYRLKNDGHPAYIVGGALRNACLERPIIDWDVATAASRGEIQDLFRDTPMFSLKHETVTLVHAGRHFEVTPFRGRQNSIRDDLSHRDFTINAMAYDVEQAKILDFHNGRQDLGRHVITATGEPGARFREDPLRLLRAARLAAELDFTIEASTRVAMKDMAPMLRSVAPERVRDELMKVLLCPRPSRGLTLMRRTGLLQYILPELLEGFLKQQNACHQYTVFRHIMETVDQTGPDPVLRLAALFHDIAKPRVRKKIHGEWRFYGHARAGADLARAIMERLRFSNAMIRKVTNLIQHHMIDYDSGWTDGAVRRLIRRVGSRQLMQLLALREADILAHGLHCQKLGPLSELKARITELSKRPVTTTPLDLAIDGHRVMGVMGIEPGPEVGILLKKLVEKVIDTPEINTEKGLVTELKHLKTR